MNFIEAFWVVSNLIETFYRGDAEIAEKNKNELLKF